MNFEITKEIDIELDIELPRRQDFSCYDDAYWARRAVLLRWYAALETRSAVQFIEPQQLPANVARDLIATGANQAVKMSAVPL
jgi:hypothetical protein